MNYYYKIFLFIFFIFILGCNEENFKLFSLLEPNETNINFINNLPYTEEYNTYTYRNFYNGGGVAIGDINNDGLLDIYFTGNLVNNKLYLNKGNWKFEDITLKAGVGCENVWSTGVSMVDINGDGLLDIYVCKGGKPGGDNRHNELFINQGNLTFKESAKEYGLDVTGLSIHAAFFDYDKDGDLDCYVLNNSLRSVGGFDLKEGQRVIPDPDGNKFFRNDGGHFINVAQEIGIYTSNIGYGLGITLSDFNNDNWTDIFISNDFFERDYLYINNQDGKFEEVGDKAFASMSMGSMGADAGDLDNDLLPDLFVTEMLPQSLERKKTKNLYETWDKYKASVDKHYHHQYSRNVLQRNVGNLKFLEIGRQAGVAATDWSWASLIQDFDNDGLKDLYISNGQFKDLLDRDYLNFSADDSRIRSGIAKNEKVLMNLIDSMPSEAISNCMYKNLGDFKFEPVSTLWGLDQKSFSNGSAYADLDNDGDLDIIVNNANMNCFIYKNNTDTLTNRWIQFELEGLQKNTNAIGAKIVIKSKNRKFFIENYSSRGFESSAIGRLHFGVGNVEKIDSAYITWPDGNISIETNLKTNKLYKLAQSTNLLKTNKEFQLKNRTNNLGINFTHAEHNLNLFQRERMLIEMNGFDGPAVAVADINNDNIDDVFFGGAKNQVSELYISKGKEYKLLSKQFDEDKTAEKVKAQFFDSDNDGDLDLYVAHGGKAFSLYSPELNDVLYINDGNGNLTKEKDFVIFPNPFSTGDVKIVDINQDQLNDIIIAEKYKTDFFGSKGSIYILTNKGNNQYLCEAPKLLQEVGMVSAIETMDVNNDGEDDIILAGKWMGIMIGLMDKGKVGKIEKIDNTNGLWNVIFKEDIDQDGDFDLICGNSGLNNFYSKEDKMFINDFDGNGSLEQIICKKIGKKYYTIHDNDEMFSQVPSLKKKFLYHQHLAKASIDDLFEKSTIKTATTFELNELNSLILVNQKGKFDKILLPNELQYSTINCINKIEEKYYFGGNFYMVKPQFGRQDASLGWKLSIDKNYKFSSPQPLYVEGQLRGIEKFNDKIIFAKNNDKVEIR